MAEFAGPESPEKSNLKRGRDDDDDDDDDDDLDEVGRVSGHYSSRQFRNPDRYRTSNSHGNFVR